MPYAHLPSRVDQGGVSLYPLGRVSSGGLLVLVFLSGVWNASGQPLAVQNPRDLLLEGVAAFTRRLDAARPSPVSPAEIVAIHATLPSDGEVTRLEEPAQRKVNAVRQFLIAARRDWYDIKVIDLPRAGMALHARALILIPAPTIALLSAAELEALVAHEIGHEYVWAEWHRAHPYDPQRLKALELVCDAIAAVTLHRLGANPSRLTDALEKVTRFNRDRSGPADNEDAYPTLAERREFLREIEHWLRR